MIHTYTSIILLGKYLKIRLFLQIELLGLSGFFQLKGKVLISQGGQGKVVTIHLPVSGDGAGHSDVSSLQKNSQHRVAPSLPGKNRLAERFEFSQFQTKHI